MTDTKTCTKCGGEFPATPEYWYRDKRLKNGLCSVCKKCMSEQNRQYRDENREQILEKQRQYRDENRDKERERARQYSAKNRGRRRQYYDENREQILEKQRQYYDENREQILEQHRQYRTENAERISEWHRQNYIKNREQIMERNRQYHAENPEVRRAAMHRYIARKRSLPSDFTAEDSRYAHDYFNDCCAVCGRQLDDLFNTHTSALDHWIPLSSKHCPGTVPTNMVPLCHGEGGCNNSKGRKLPANWLKQQYGTRKANEILERIEAFFETVRQVQS